MKNSSIRALLYPFMEFFALVAAWAMIPAALAIYFFLPLAMWIRLALVVLLIVVFVSSLIKATLNGQLRKTSSLCFYAAPIAVILFLILIAAQMHMGRDRIEEAFNSIYQARHRPGIGLMVSESQRRNMLSNHPKLELLASSQNIVNASILGYKVCSYNLQDLTYLFDEIFIHQQYFFVADSEKPFVIDCGSHLGMSILYAKALYPQAQVIAFEPAPGTFRFLSKNISQNGLRDVTLINKAIGKKKGTMTFYGDNSMVASLIENRGNRQNVVEIEVVPLSEYIDRQVDFLKIDVEGIENLVLEDLASSKKLQLIKRMTVEYHHHIDKNVDTLSAFLKLLEDNNFGYQIRVPEEPAGNMVFQDILIYAYRKLSHQPAVDRQNNPQL